MTSVTHAGLDSIASNASVEETVERLTAILADKGVKLFAVIDHSGEAAAAGMYMPPTKVVVFGNPKGGTPLMLASPSVAIDLPLKVLVAQNGDEPGAGVTVTWNSAEYLRERHGLPDELMANIAVIETLARKAAAAE